MCVCRLSCGCVVLLLETLQGVSTFRCVLQLECVVSWQETCVCLHCHMCTDMCGVGVVEGL